MSYHYITFEIAGGVGRIMLNRPEVLNSFNRPMARELQQTLLRCAGDDVRVVLLSGNGRAFCAGQDLAEAAPDNQPWPPLQDIVRESYNATIRALRSLEKPVVAAVNGVAAGAGANIALACDLVIASEKASFLQAFCHIGLIPDSGGTWFLPRLVGLPRATALMMLGEKISAGDAQAMGMIYQVYPEESFAAECKQLCARLASMPTLGLGLIKRALNHSFDNSLDEQLQLEEDLQARAGASEDYREGVMAFLEKRKPQFKGK